MNERMYGFLDWCMGYEANIFYLDNGALSQIRCIRLGVLGQIQSKDVFHQLKLLIS